MPSHFHVQFGLSRHVGRFASDANGPAPRAGQAVVVRSSRGTEIGTVIAEAEGPPEDADRAEIVRLAGPDDLERAARLREGRHARFDEFRRVFDEGVWPIEPVDVEPLLDENRVVLHYLGPHRLDLAGLRAALRVSLGIDLVFEPVGRDVPEEVEDLEDEAEEGGCGAGGCGSGGGCGSKSSSGCGSCSVAGLVASRRAKAARAG